MAACRSKRRARPLERHFALLLSLCVVVSTGGLLVLPNLFVGTLSAQWLRVPCYRCITRSPLLLCIGMIVVVFPRLTKLYLVTPLPGIRTALSQQLTTALRQISP